MKQCISQKRVHKRKGASAKGSCSMRHTKRGIKHGGSGRVCGYMEGRARCDDYEGGVSMKGKYLREVTGGMGTYGPRGRNMDSEAISSSCIVPGDRGLGGGVSYGGSRHRSGTAHNG